MKKVLGVLTLLVLLFALSSCLNPPEKMDDGPLKASYNPNTGYINLKWIYDEKYTTFFVYAKGTNDSDYVLLNSLNKKELTFSPPQGLSCSVMVEAEYNGIKSTGITTTVSTPYLSIVGTYKIYVLLDEDIYFTNFVILSQDEGTMYAKFGVDTSYKYFSSANFDGTFEKKQSKKYSWV